MAEPEEFLSRDEVLGGLPARRAHTLLFLIERESALHASEREVGTMALLGERSAEGRSLAWIEAFALRGEVPRTPSIREIEAAADRWAPLVPDSPEVRAAVFRLLTEHHRLQARHVPGIRAALGARDVFGGYLAFGITLLFGVQSLFNVSVVLGIVPNKGITLPLVSYGGSSLVITMFLIGLLLNVGRRPEREPRRALTHREASARKRRVRVRVASPGAATSPT